MFFTPLLALATLALSAPLESSLDARDNPEFSTNVDVYGNSFSIGDISAFEFVREALDDLCKGTTCDTTRKSSMRSTERRYKDRASELSKLDLQISARGTFPVIDGDGGQLARDSLKTAMVEAVRLAEQRQWLEYSIYPAGGGGVGSIHFLKTEWDWFGSINPQFDIVRSHTIGAGGGELHVTFHAEAAGPKADFCKAMSKVAGGLGAALGLVPGAGAYLGFLGSITSQGLSNC